MTVLTTPGFSEYALLDSGEGYRLEQFGEYTLARPDPQCIWKKKKPALWENVDAVFEHKDWKRKTTIPEKWKMQYDGVSFFARLTPFKHTGIFPEQVLQWMFMQEKLRGAKNKGQREIKVLNLFGYTGIASLVCAKEGARITHVDASRPSITWARENLEASGLSDKPVRWILEDTMKFCEREARRGNTYDGILMDPPIYGHGPEGERWDFFSNFPRLLDVCVSLLSNSPLFLIVNAYAISASSLMLDNLLKERLGSLGGMVESGELALEEKESDRLLSTGIFSRWSNS